MGKGPEIEFRDDFTPPPRTIQEIQQDEEEQLRRATAAHHADEILEQQAIQEHGRKLGSFEQRLESLEADLRVLKATAQRAIDVAEQTKRRFKRLVKALAGVATNSNSEVTSVLIDDFKTAIRRFLSTVANMDKSDVG